jgi:drug/metabolite transporter (DMT)-like permease
VVGLGLVGVTLVAAGVAAPGVWPAFLYGAQAAGVVLALVAAILWVRQQRWRRQVILMPGFRRRKTGSSLLRGQGSRPPREPSTVDGPAVGGRFGPEGASA